MKNTANIVFLIRKRILTMAGRRPIFVTLVTDIYTFLRDTTFKATLEPSQKKKKKKEITHKKWE